MDLEDLYLSQGLMQIEKFVQHIGANSITGKLIRVSLELCQLEVGIGQNIFSLHYSDHHFLVEDSWIKNIWKFTSEYSITIINRITELPLPQREGDVFLMEEFHNQGYSKHQLEILNQCRIYLRVLTLADVMTGAGDSFTEAYLCQRETQPRNNYVWPRQEEPTQNMKKLWKKALRKTFGLKQGVTEYKLGKWLNDNFHQWIWFYEPDSDNLYQKSNNRWTVWKRSSQREKRGKGGKYKYFSECILPPSNIQQATVSARLHKTVLLTGFAASYKDEITKSSERISTNDITLNIIHNDLNIDNFKTALQQGLLNVISDGSFFPEEKVGAAAWIIEEDISDTYIAGAMPSVGDTSIQNLCRSELIGLYYTLLHLLSLCTQHDITNGKVTLHCDGLSALQKINYQTNEMYSIGENFDIINALIAVKHKLPLEIQYEHVKGHQDKGTAYHNLSRIAQLNVLVDSMAKHEAKLQIKSKHSYHFESLPYSPCDILITTTSFKTHKINHNLHKTLRHLVTEPALQKYWIKKHQLTTTHRCIDWQLRSRSLKNIPSHQQRWLCKFSTGFCGVGKMLHRYKWQPHTQCLRCLKDKEDTQHVLQCKHTEVTEIWEKQLEKLGKWMKENNIHNELNTIIINSLQAWVNKEHLVLHPSNHLLAQAVHQQQRIGWFQFTLGFWSTRLVQCQQQHMKDTRDTRSTQLLLSKVQRRIWQIAWDIWEHRNKFLHKTNHSYHPTEIKAINQEIIQEWTRNLDKIPSTFESVSWNTPATTKNITHSKIKMADNHLVSARKL